MVTVFTTGGNTLWLARHIRSSLDAVARETERLAAATVDAPPGLADAIRLLRDDAKLIADRARRVAHRLEAELAEPDPPQAA